MRDAKAPGERFLRNPPWRDLPKGLRYLCVGATCAVISNLLLLWIATAGLGYAASSMLALIPMFFIGYALHVFVTFEARPSLGSFLRFCLALIASYPVALALLFLFCDVAKLPLSIAAPLSTAFMVVWNYMTTHWAILRSLRAALSQ